MATYKISLGPLCWISSPESWNELCSLAYWIADKSYCEERYGATVDGTERAHKTITQCIFPALDRLKVPFWVQNRVIVWAEDWRKSSSATVQLAFMDNSRYKIEEVKIA